MAEEKKKKQKRPTAAKRQIQDAKKELVNKIFKSKARTTVRHFEEALANKNGEEIQKKLNDLYSSLDRGVKRGIYKPNKAARSKARATKKVALLSS